tara:strand:+ start:20 stop:190 length:171 start_codon:yes stop_codon:yes gene_type:complete
MLRLLRLLRFNQSLLLLDGFDQQRGHVAIGNSLVTIAACMHELGNDRFNFLSNQPS